MTPRTRTTHDARTERDARAARRAAERDARNAREERAARVARRAKRAAPYIVPVPALVPRSPSPVPVLDNISEDNNDGDRENNLEEERREDEAEMMKWYEILKEGLEEIEEQFEYEEYVREDSIEY